MPRPVALFTALTIPAIGALAQCTLQPVATGIGVPSTSGNVLRSIWWDADGAGPQPTRLVVGGAFALVGDTIAQSAAAFEPVAGQWSALGALSSPPNSFAVLPNGTLLAAGLFYFPGGGAATLMQWNGTGWQQFAPQPVGVVGAMVVAANGDLIATASQAPGAIVQRFAGGAWQTIGTATNTLGAPGVGALAVLANGDIVVGGGFSAINGVAANNLARWNGTAWAPLGSGLAGIVRALHQRSNGDLVAAGLFSLVMSGPTANIARWNGTTWASLGSGTQGALPAYAGVFALAELPNGDLVAGGQFNAAGGTAAAKVARWDGTAWSPMGAGIEPHGLLEDPSSVWTLATAANGDVFAGGTFAMASGHDATGLARWNGTTWNALQARGIGRAATHVHRTTAGDVYLGGSFLDIDGVACNGIARRSGSTWVPLGSGVQPNGYPLPYVSCLDSLPSGEVVVGGAFLSVGGTFAPGLAAWNGASWHALGTGLANAFRATLVDDLHVAANGSLLAAGDFDSAGGVAVDSVARWNGTAWSAIGPGLNATTTIGPPSLQCVTQTPNGDVFVAGTFTLGGFAFSPKVARWNGTAWQSIGVLDGAVQDLLALPNGDVLACGAFTTVDALTLGSVVRWSNGVWSAVGAGIGLPPESAFFAHLERLPGGAVVAGGFLESGGNHYPLARFDGVSWTPFATSLGSLIDFTVDPAGELLAVGNFTAVGSTASAYFSRIPTPCPASATASGAGCTGSGGANSLAATSLPWLGAPFTAAATGMPVGGLALAVYGLGTTSVPLASILPQGTPGCSLQVTPDLLLAYIAQNPLSTSLPLPPTPTLVGAVLHHQVVPLDIVAGAIAAITSTNRLTLTLGLF